MKRVHVELTQEDIDHGKPESCSECPVARAVARAMGVVCVVHVDCQIAVSDGDTWWTPLPAVVETFVDNFDNVNQRVLCEPFAFDLELLRWDEGVEPA